MRDVSGLLLEEAFARFINSKKALNRAEETIKYYEERFELFNDYLKGYKNITATNQVDEDCITDYILHTREKSPHMSENTMNNRLRAIRAMLYYFMEKGYTEPFHISLLSVRQIPKEGYSSEQLQKLI